MIENTVEAWKINGNGPEDYVILSGRNYPERKLQNVRVVEGLDYMDLSDATDPLILKERMEEAARSVLGQLPDVWHIHNHSLGKNSVLVVRFRNWPSPVHDYFSNPMTLPKMAAPRISGTWERPELSFIQPLDKFTMLHSIAGISPSCSQPLMISTARYICWLMPFPSNQLR